MSSPISVEDYLRRIDYDGKLEANLACLRQLQLAHMLAVPFENLDITLGIPISLEIEDTLQKIVVRHRGGFCYELNSAFAWLLGEIGFTPELLSARVYSEGQAGPEFDHLLLRVDTGETIYTDVGFGDSFLLPLRANAEPSFQLDRYYRILSDAQDLVLEQQFPEQAADKSYRFSPQSRRIEEFHARCSYLQTDPASVFTQKTVCSRATVDGRITYANGRLIETNAGQRQETRFDNPTRLGDALAQHFRFRLRDNELQRLWQAAQARRHGAS